MKQTLLILTGYLMMVLTAMADNKQVEQLYDAADAAYAQQNYKEAERLAKEALPLSKGTGIEADCLNLLAITYIRLADYDEAAKYAKECYALDEKTGDPDVMSSSLNTLAAIYMGANQPQEAEKYVLKGLEMAEKANNPFRMAVLQAMASVGMSLFQFRQHLTALTDETPQNFIQNVRMKRARHLLDNHPELNVSEIATLCAYNDTPNFTRAFKKTFGVTPTQYLDRKG